MSVEIQTFPTRAGWAAACADRMTGALSGALAERPRAFFAGSGGSTPGPVYAAMREADLDWSRVTVTLVDERHVPESSSESNATLLKNSLPIGPGQAGFIPLYSAAPTVDRAAAVATRALASQADRLDAALLGMGEDGHILSMFPESPTLKTLLIPTLTPAVLGVPKGRDGLAPSLERLSMNLPWLMACGTVVMALSGSAKRRVFEDRIMADPAIVPVAALAAHIPHLQVLWTEESA
ncbi:6-phosphogluconolactonase [Brevundimonas sp.]|uniref:6-phosphogluconolactonase n=1 Tax=Brevundimonas sp. TaxID=1871086 RepID=UPI003AF93A03